MWQENGLSPECTRRWRIRLEAYENLCGHSLHVYGCSPVCVRRCLLRSPAWLNSLRQNSHVSWRRRCRLLALEFISSASHWSTALEASSGWASMTRASLIDVVELRSTRSRVWESLWTSIFSWTIAESLLEIISRLVASVFGSSLPWTSLAIIPSIGKRKPVFLK